LKLVNVLRHSFENYRFGIGIKRYRFSSHISDYIVISLEKTHTKKSLF